MNNAFFAMYALSHEYDDPEYHNLSDEERTNLDFMNECLFSENEKINNASFYMMMLIIKMSDNIDSYTEEKVKTEMDIIKSGLTDDEKNIIDNFAYSCINSIGIYNEESKKLRRQKMKGMIKLCQK